MFTGIYQKISSLVEKIRPASKQKKMMFFGIFLMILAVGILIPQAFAHANLLDKTTDVLMEFLAHGAVAMAGFFLKMSIFLLKFVIELAGYNGYLDSPAVQVGWVMVRDITNMFFVVILLAIAFGTILGIEQYEWRKLLVKFVLAAIFVNFSRIICGVIIDVAQVVMVTFVNGVAATAGGNLINAFSLDQILSLSKTASASDFTNPSAFFIGAVAAAAFAGMLMAIMGVYMIILLARMITLWVLIVLSPIAFVTSVLPQTQSISKGWWKEFGNHVVAGPLVIFFIWLSFVTVGSGDIHTKVQQDALKSTRMEASDAELDAAGGAASAGIGQAMTWASMANFFIALGMLLIGAKKSQELGVAGGSMMGKAVDFGKKVAGVASGFAAGRWAYEKGLKPAAKAVAMNVPLVGGKAMQRYGARITDKKLELQEKWNQGSFAKKTGWQFGRHEKFMKEMKMIEESRKGRVSSSAKGRETPEGEGKKGSLERLKSRVNVMQGQDEVRKASSERVRSQERAEASTEILRSDTRVAEKFQRTILNEASAKAEKSAYEAHLQLAILNADRTPTESTDREIALRDRNIAALARQRSQEEALSGARTRGVTDEMTRRINEELNRFNTERASTDAGGQVQQAEEANNQATRGIRSNVNGVQREREEARNRFTELRRSQQAILQDERFASDRSEEDRGKLAWNQVYRELHESNPELYTRVGGRVGAWEEESGGQYDEDTRNLQSGEALRQILEADNLVPVIMEGNEAQQIALLEQIRQALINPEQRQQNIHTINSNAANRPILQAMFGRGQINEELIQRQQATSLNRIVTTLRENQAHQTTITNNERILSEQRPLVAQQMEQYIQSRMRASPEMVSWHTKVRGDHGDAQNKLRRGLAEEAMAQVLVADRRGFTLPTTSGTEAIATYQNNHFKGMTREQLLNAYRGMVANMANNHTTIENYEGTPEYTHDLYMIFGALQEMHRLNLHDDVTGITVDNNLNDIVGEHTAGAIRDHANELGVRHRREQARQSRGSQRSFANLVNSQNRESIRSLLEQLNITQTGLSTREIEDRVARVRNENNTEIQNLLRQAGVTQAEIIRMLNEMDQVGGDPNTQREVRAVLNL